MFRSPPLLRSGSKGQRLPLDNEELRSPLSASSSPSCPDKQEDMAPTNENKSKATVDATLIAESVNKYLAADDVLCKIAAKLGEQIKGVVEEAVRVALATVNAEVERLRGEVASLQQRVAVTDDKLEARTDELEQYQRRNNLRIFGVEEMPGEDTDHIVTALCTEKLKMDLPADALCRSHRVGRQPGPTPEGRKRHRPIIVRFTSYRERRRVFDAKSKLKGTGIVVREDLTKARQEVLKAAVDRYGLRSTWTMDGRVLWKDEDGGRGSATRLSDIPSATTKN